MKEFSFENTHVGKQAQVIKNAEGNNNSFVNRRDGGYTDGVKGEPALWNEYVLRVNGYMAEIVRYPQ